MSASSSCSSRVDLPNDLPAPMPRQKGDRSVVALRLEKIFAEINGLRAAVERESLIDESEKALWGGIEAIQDAISKTRGEVERLHGKAVHNQEFNRATDELDAVVSDTERATETILSSAEAIDEIARGLLKRVDGADRDAVAEIHANAIRIFEACNFQDITGQRISKVVRVLKFIEAHVASMLKIWEGVEGFSSPEPHPSDQRTGEEALLNGPALDGETNVVSQDDIDSLFP